MSHEELMKHLGVSRYRYYALRHAGIIPPPATGVLSRKHYSRTEVQQIITRLKELGEIGAK